MLFIRKLMYVTIFASTALGACVATRGADPADDTQLDTASSETAPQIKSAHDLDAYARAKPDFAFNQLSTDAKQRFLDSLVFTQLGLASYETADLMTLSANQRLELLAVLNVEHTAAMLDQPHTSNAAGQPSTVVNPREDYRDYKCLPPATCITALTSICIAVNCRTP